MTSNNIEKENTRLDIIVKESDFCNSISVEFYDRIISFWEEERPSGRGWWYEYSLYAVHVLNSVSMRKSYDINESNYHLFIPIMKKYFLTIEEYDIIVKNIAFVKKDNLKGLIDTPLFKVFSMLKFWNVSPTIENLINMDYKTFIKLYLYTVGDRFIKPINPKEKGDYRG